MSMLTLFALHFVENCSQLKRTFLSIIYCAGPNISSLSFNFTTFDNSNRDIFFLNDSFISDGVIQLTRNQQDLSLKFSVGRAYYSLPVPLYDKTSKKLTDFTTHFSFIIKQVRNTSHGDGLSFFLAPVNSSVPEDSSGGNLGLVSASTNNDTSKNQIVAVEFDSFKNPWDPSDDHVGIDVNSIVSVANVSWKSSIKNGSKANAWITYDSLTKNLSVFLIYADDPVFNSNSTLSYVIDLSTVLPERIQVGFSAATGGATEIHNILSWDFNSTLPDAEDKTDTQKPTQPKKNVGLIAGVVIGICFVLFGFGLVLYILGRRNPEVKNDVIDGTGPKRFTYLELSRATNDFAEDGKLGEGGFGGVYKGVLSEPSREIAVKRISKGSKQGKKEYASEVKTISQLRHRNLVQLLGWSHDKGELLLVYEFMPNGSLDYHLYGTQSVALQWKVRYKVARNLASALLYLHQEWDQCVIHRDIKSSNIMLDSDFNAKLGDFGLARLIEHGLGSQSTVPAGTLGYMAPECLVTGKASMESDVYSFGVVALELACGRRPVESREEPSKVWMVEWVWNLYGNGLLLEAVDPRLEGVFEIREIERLMVVGLWCCHPDHSQRPSIRRVVNVLNQDSPLPSLPPNLPVPTYFVPTMNMDMYSNTTSYVSTGSTATRGSSSQSVLPGPTPLLSQRSNI